MGENNFAAEPMALYSANLLMCALAYTGLVRALTGIHGHGSEFARALGSDRKGKVSLAIYGLAIAAAFVLPLAAFLLLVTVAIIWIVPDRRFAKVAAPDHPSAP